MLKKLVLASLSPRRKQLLEQVGLEFEILGTDADEQIEIRLSPAQNAEWVALQKAQAAALLAKDAAILAADTMVVVDGDILGKPLDEKDAVRMLTLLQGRWHEVVTGYALLLPGERARTGSAVTKVSLAPMSPGAIQRYIKEYRPMDKAGAYGIQDGMARYIRGVEGCFYNVMGLPVERVCRLLEDAGVIEE